MTACSHTRCCQSDKVEGEGPVGGKERENQVRVSACVHMCVYVCMCMCMCMCVCVCVCVCEYVRGGGVFEVVQHRR